MSRQEKLLTKIRNNPRGVKFRDLTKVLEWYEFELRRVTGSHYIYKRAPYTISVPRHGKQVHSYIVKEVLRAIDELSDRD
jgi:predicted RNA binding protein YcfA (HicA-like mRNA interferase family)